MAKENSAGATAKLPRITDDAPESNRLRATGTDGATRTAQRAECDDLRMAPRMADSGSFQGVLQSSPGTLAKKAGADKNPEKPAQDLSGHVSASCDSDMTLAQKLEAGGIETRFPLFRKPLPDRGVARNLR